MVIVLCDRKWQDDDVLTNIDYVTCLHTQHEQTNYHCTPESGIFCELSQTQFISIELQNRSIVISCLWNQTHGDSANCSHSPPNYNHIVSVSDRVHIQSLTTVKHWYSTTKINHNNNKNASSPSLCSARKFQSNADIGCNSRARSFMNDIIESGTNGPIAVVEFNRRNQHTPTVTSVRKYTSIYYTRMLAEPCATSVHRYVIICAHARGVRDVISFAPRERFSWTNGRRARCAIRSAAVVAVCVKVVCVCVSATEMMRWTNGWNAYNECAYWTHTYTHVYDGLHTRPIIQYMRVRTHILSSLPCPGKETSSLSWVAYCVFVTYDYTKSGELVKVSITVHL